MALFIKKMPLQAEYNQPLSKVKPLIVRESKENQNSQNIAKESAEAQSLAAKQRETAKKTKIEDFQSKIRLNASRIERENKEARQTSISQKMADKTRFLNVSKDYAERSLALFKRKREDSKKPIENEILPIKEEPALPKAEVIYPQIGEKDEFEEIDESLLKSVDETVQDHASLREKLKAFNFLDSKSYNYLNP